MTYSIVARDPETGQYGVAVASRFFAVGAVPFCVAQIPLRSSACIYQRRRKRQQKRQCSDWTESLLEKYVSSAALR